MPQTCNFLAYGGTSFSKSWPPLRMTNEHPVQTFTGHTLLHIMVPYTCRKKYMRGKTKMLNNQARIHLSVKFLLQITITVYMEQLHQQIIIYHETNQ